MDECASSYGGPERRRHRMYITRNTEYHFRDGVCVAVRDRSTERWRINHDALRRRLAGAVRFYGNGTAVPSQCEPEVGEALYFSSDGSELVTSLLCDVKRPQKTLVEQYP